MKETIIQEGGHTRVIRLGGIRVDWQIEKLIRELLKCLDAKDMKTWKGRREACLISAGELGWHRNGLGNWERE